MSELKIAFSVIRATQISDLELPVPDGNWEVELEEVATHRRVHVSVQPIYGTWEETFEAAAVRAREILTMGGDAG